MKTFTQSLFAFAITLSLALAGAVPAFAQPATLRILPVGDSITLGYNVPGGYRARLYQLLTNAGYAADFLGTQTANGAPSLPDSDHAGYGGYRIDQIDALVSTMFSVLPEPDVILLLIGSSDFAQGYDMNNAMNRLESLIGKMASSRPNARIIVANLLVRNEPFNSQIQMMFNPFVPGICDRQRALGRRVYFNDLRSAVTMGDLADSVHPNALGYAKLATNWFAAITAAIETNGGGHAFTAEADTYVRNGSYAATNFGSAAALSVYKGAENEEAFLRFALTNVYAHVLEAKLRLRPVAVSAPATHVLELVEDNLWAEMSTAWNNRPDSGVTLGTWDVSHAPVEVDVTAAVRQVITNGGRVSFRIFAPATAPFASYAARETSALYSPRLILQVSNTPPAIAAIPDQVVNRNDALTLPLTLGDAETPVERLILSASVSNPGLIPSPNIVFGGSNEFRSVTLVPASNLLGTATIFLTVNDGLRSTTTSFALSVIGTNTAPTSIAFINPPNNSVYNAPINITFRSSAVDPDGNMARVDYYLGNAIFAIAFNPPYAVTLNNIPAGVYDWRCVATDAGGLSVTSSLQRVTVQPGSLTLIPAGAVWKYYDVNGVDLGTAWRTNDYNDSAWLAGPARLGFGDPATTMVNPDMTRITTYFRTRFTLADPATVTNLACGVVRDDGAVVYLNGVEVFRTGMPAGTILYDTLASSAISGAEETTWFTNIISSSLLRTGTNVVAVELHQGSANSSDLGFSLLLVGGTPGRASERIPLASSRNGNQLTFAWPASSGWNLYTSPSLRPDALWIRIMTGTVTMNGQTFYTVPMVGAAGFFQLRQP